MARRVFLQLTELGDDTTTGDGRRRVAFDELVIDARQADALRALLQRLADARLITMGQETIEVAHEALIREWPRLRTWLDEDRQGLRMHRRISEAAREWATNDRDGDLLFRGARLMEAEEWNRANVAELSDLEREFMTASTHGREREAAEREAQRQQALEAAQQLAASEKSHSDQLSKRALYLGGALILALVMALATLYFGAQARRTAIDAQTDRRVATARELSAAALNNLDIDPERSILLAQQAIATTKSVDGSVLPEALGALHSALIGSPIRHTLTGHAGRVLSVAYHPDGKQLASIEDDGTVIVWDAETGAELSRAPGSSNAQRNHHTTAHHIQSGRGDLAGVRWQSADPDRSRFRATSSVAGLAMRRSSRLSLSVGMASGSPRQMSRAGSSCGSTRAQEQLVGWDAHEAEVEVG